MASNSDDYNSNTSKPIKAPTEKKKRKRPSKKVPTTVLQANNSGFMHLVQKLTGSAEELAAAGDSSNQSHSPYSSPSSQLLPTTTYQHSTTTNDVDTSHDYHNYSTTAPYSNAPPFIGSFPDPYQTYQEPAPSSNYGSNSTYGSNYGYGGGYGTGGYGSGGHGGSGSRSYGDDDENSYGYHGSVDPSDRYNNNNNSSPSSSRGMDHGSPNDFGNHASNSDYYW